MKIDLWDPESFAAGHPHAQYDWLRSNAPVHFQNEPDGPGYWAVTRWSDIRFVNESGELFSHAPVSMISSKIGSAASVRCWRYARAPASASAA